MSRLDRLLRVNFRGRFHAWIMAIDDRMVRRRWGKLRSNVIDTLEYVVCELEMLDQNGNRIGYWGYGSWDPSYPYQGNGWFYRLFFKP